MYSWVPSGKISIRIFSFFTETFSDTVMDNVYKMAEKLSEQPSDHQRELLKSVQNVGGYKPPTSYHDDTTPLVTSHRQEGKSTTGSCTYRS